MIIHNIYCKIGLHESTENEKIIPTRKPPYYETLLEIKCIHCGKLIKIETY